MLVDDTEKEVDQNVLNLKNRLAFKLNKTKELLEKSVAQLSEYKTKHELYAIVLISNRGAGIGLKARVFVV